MPRKSYRFAGKIKANKRQGIPTHALFLDTETYTRFTRDKRVVFPLRLGVAIYNRYDKNGAVKHRFISRFTTPQQFIKILSEYLHKGKTLYVFGHNIGFDIRVLNLPFIFNKIGWNSTPPIINNRLFIWRVSSPNGSIAFVDTANYGVISVSQLGDDLGYPKLHIDFRTKDVDKLFEYCQRDVEIIEKFMGEYILFVRSNGLGVFQLSIASQSLMAWRTKFMTSDVYLHTKDDISQFERSAYHGGRTECFHIGQLPKSDYYYLDINSMYPYVMRTYAMPTKLICYSEKIDMDKIKAIMSKFYIIADCIIKTDVPAYGMVHNDKLVFPIGEFRIILHHAELEYAIAHNHLVQIIGYTIYQKAIIFSDYVDWFYELKIKYTISHNVTLRYIIKLFMNSLYGKMGQLKPNRIEIKGKFPNDILRQCGYNTTLKAHIDEVIWFGRGWIEYRKGESTYSFPAIAGAVTAYARMELWKFIEQAGRNNVFYCDTDSIITNKIGYNNVGDKISSQTLGYLKLEKRSNILRIWGNKDYKFGRETKTKGISHKAKKVADDVWEQLQFQGFSAWMSSQTSRIPFATRITKRRRFSYNKGIVDYETGNVYPISLHL